MDMGEPGKRVLLAVLAHPDDESFGLGGTLAYYARQGVDVYLVCATRGEVGEVPPEMLEGYASVAELREAELRCAVDVLGIKGLFLLGYRDSGMAGSPENGHPQALAAAPLEDVADAIAEHMRRLQPQVVLTFDPNGGYFHPDHIAIHRAAKRAFELLQEKKSANGYAPQKLYFHLVPRWWAQLGVWSMRLSGKDPRRMGRNGDIDLLAVLAEKFPVNARIDVDGVYTERMKAFACHASQGGGAAGGRLGEWFSRWLSRKDLFMRGAPDPGAGKVERDLFEGVQF